MSDGSPEHRRPHPQPMAAPYLELDLAKEARRPHCQGNLRLEDLDRDSTVMYIDWAHLNPQGNQRVARRIVAALGDTINVRPLAASRPKRAGAGQRGGDQ